VAAGADLVVGLDVGGTKLAVRAETVGGSPVADVMVAASGWSATPAGTAALWISGHLSRCLPAGARVVAAGIGAQGCDSAQICSDLRLALGALLRRDDAAPADAPCVRDILEQEIIGKAVALLSGPGGLAGFLRRRQLGSRLAGLSLPLDVGVSSDIPAAIRRAVIERDQHCRFPSGCDQPAAGCEVHHLTHKADGGKTSVWDCALFCWFHHQVEIHRNGWTVVLNPDGTTTAWNKDRTKVLHSHSRNHSPPPRPG
jgi:hypothetical protein